MGDDNFGATSLERVLQVFGTVENFEQRLRSFLSDFGFKI
jgi:hypothetical protein